MTRRSGLFDKSAGVTKRPHLDTSRLTGSPISWLTPNRLVMACRALLAVLMMTMLVMGPDDLGSPAQRFFVAYGVTLVAMPALPRISTRNLGGALALLFGIRWVFSTPDGATAEMLLTQLAGIGCAMAPVYARNLGGLAGAREGHISFTDRRTMWRQRSTGAPRSPASATTPPAATPVTPTTALLDYRPDTRS